MGEGMTDSHEHPVSLCGECGKRYGVDVRRCPDCGTTLVVWRPTSEPEGHARRWWAIVNWSFLGFSGRPLLDDRKSADKPPAISESKPD
jgi:hypothetical protein